MKKPVLVILGPLGPTSLAEPNETYVENRFSSKEYRELYKSASSSIIKSRLRSAKFRDKRFQRLLVYEDIRNIFYCEYNKIPLYMNPNNSDNDVNEIVKDIIRWRLSIHK